MSVKNQNGSSSMPTFTSNIFHATKNWKILMIKCYILRKKSWLNKCSKMSWSDFVKSKTYFWCCNLPSISLQELVFNNIAHKAPQSDFIQLDDLLIDLKLNEDALEVPIPRFFLTENKEALDYRNQIHVRRELRGQFSIFLCRKNRLRNIKVHFQKKKKQKMII